MLHNEFDILNIYAFDFERSKIIEILVDSELVSFEISHMESSMMNFLEIAQLIQRFAAFRATDNRVNSEDGKHTVFL